MKDAMELTCEHSLCSSCLDKWQMTAADMNTPFTCPQCRLTISTEMVKRNGTINRIIQTSVQVKCTQNSAGCEWVGVISDVEDHITQTCAVTVINCTHANCEERVRRGSLPEHLSTCNFRLVLCDHCNEDFVCNQLEDHLLECEMYPVQCDRKGCEAAVPRILIQQHKDEECEYKPMDCQYISIGCEAKFPRSRQDHHEHQSMASHMSLLRRNNLDVHKEMEATKIELMRTKEILLEREDYLESLEEQIVIKFKKTEQRTTTGILICLKNKGEELVKMKQKNENLEEHIEGLQEKIIDLKQILAVNRKELSRESHRTATTERELVKFQRSLSHTGIEMERAKLLLKQTKSCLARAEKKLENAEYCLKATKNQLKGTRQWLLWTGSFLFICFTLSLWQNINL